MIKANSKRVKWIEIRSGLWYLPNELNELVSGQEVFDLYICKSNTGLFLQSCDLVVVIPKERSMHRTAASLVLLREEAFNVVQMWLLSCSHIYNVSSFCFVIVSNPSSFLEETFFLVGSIFCFFQVGFEMVDAIVEAEGISMNSVSFKALFGKGWPPCAFLLCII